MVHVKVSFLQVIAWRMIVSEVIGIFKNWRKDEMGIHPFILLWLDKGEELVFKGEEA